MNTSCSLRIRSLNAGMILNNFIDKKQRQYEEYLLEFVNASSFFAMKSKGDKYYRPASENNKENDCISDAYSMDFKLVVAESKMENNRWVTDQIQTKTVGGSKFYCFGASRAELQRITNIKTGNRLNVLLRLVNLEDMKRIYKKGNKRLNEEEKDIKAFMKKLKTQKNLLLFFPYHLFYEHVDDEEKDLLLCVEELGKDFASAMCYRQEMVPDKDTFFSFIYQNQYFVIAECMERDLHYVEKIRLDESPAFCKDLYLFDMTGGL